MSTPKNLIIKTFLSLIDDRNLCVNLTDEEMTEILDYYLKDSTYLRFKSCLKDLSDNEPYDFHTDTFVADGINKTYILTDYPNSPNPDAIEYFATVENENVEYTFDENTLTFTLTNLPTLSDEVKIGYSFTGQFAADLTEEEILILAYNMLLSWFSKILYKHENYKNKISPKDYNSFSSANLLDKLIQIKKETEKSVKQLIVNYTFSNDFKGFN
jgi:hypothetical protein